MSDEHSDDFDHANVVIVAAIIGTIVFVVGMIGLVGNLGG